MSLREASMNGDLDSVKRLIQDDAQSYVLNEALRISAWYGYLPVVQYLI